MMNIAKTFWVSICLIIIGSNLFSVSLGAPTDYFTTVQKAYLAYYGRPADPPGLVYWSNRLDQVNGNLDGIISDFGQSDEFNQRFINLSNFDLVSNIYLNLFGRSPDAAGLIFYVTQIDTHNTDLQHVALDILNGAQGDDSLLINKKIVIAEYFTNQLIVENKGGYYTLSVINDVKQVLENITASNSSLDDLVATKAQLDMIIDQLGPETVVTPISQGIVDPGNFGDNQPFSLANPIKPVGFDDQGRKIYIVDQGGQDTSVPSCINGLDILSDCDVRGLWTRGTKTDEIWSVRFRPRIDDPILTSRIELITNPFGVGQLSTDEPKIVS